MAEKKSKVAPDAKAVENAAKKAEKAAKKSK